MNPVKISVIMPCFNSGSYLAECIDSVLRQTFSDFQLILIDDGSTDDTMSIALRYAELDSRISVYHQINSGVSAARNLGLLHASGEWITFVDSDDLLPADAFEVLLTGEEDGVDMIVGAHETFDESGVSRIVIPESRWMELCGTRQKNAVVRRLIEGDVILNIMCNKLHRRTLIEREQICLHPDVRIAEDALFNLEAVLSGGRTVYINRVTYRYRMHGASAMHTQSAGEFSRHEPWFCAMKDMLLRRGMMHRYYGAYLDSVVLRLYKDGGIPGVIREFEKKAKRMLPDIRSQNDHMTPYARLMIMLVNNGFYPAAYPVIWFIQTFMRKINEAAFKLRAPKEMPR